MQKPSEVQLCYIPKDQILVANSLAHLAQSFVYGYKMLEEPSLKIVNLL